MILSILLCLFQVTTGLCSTLNVNRDPLKYASYPIKTVLVGNVYVGKTCLFHALSRSTYQIQPPTIGADVQQINLIAATERTLQNVTVSLWDTAGLEQYRCITRSHAQGADIVVAVFEATKFENMRETVEEWREALVEMSEFRRCKVFLVGAKYDLVQMEIDAGDSITPLTDDDVNQFALECGYDGGMVVSSLTGFQIGDLMGRLGYLCGLVWEERVAAIQERLLGSVSDGVQEPQDSNCCVVL